MTDAEIQRLRAFAADLCDESELTSRNALGALLVKLLDERTAMLAGVRKTIKICVDLGDSADAYAIAERLRESIGDS